MRMTLDRPAHEHGTIRVAPGGRESARQLSPRLAVAVGGLAVLLRREPDTTLEELRAALLTTGYRWSPEGKLALAADRAALLAEFDSLINRYGRDANAARLLL